MNPQIEVAINAISTSFPNAEASVSQAKEINVITAPENLEELCMFLKDDERCFFDQLACLTAIDDGPKAGTVSLVYNLYSIPFNQKASISIAIARDEAKVPSVSNIWQTANWHEREAYDLVGVTFISHPDMKRILLPNDWVGHPLRKDFSEPEKYHGIKVTY